MDSNPENLYVFRLSYGLGKFRGLLVCVTFSYKSLEENRPLD